MIIDKGATINFRTKDPTNRPSRFDNPSEIAPSSRNGNTPK